MIVWGHNPTEKATNMVLVIEDIPCTTIGHYDEFSSSMSIGTSIFESDHDDMSSSNFDPSMQVESPLESSLLNFT
jgi:hypothetical protein